MQASVLERDPTLAQERVVDEYERRYNDTTTLAAEMLDGSMKTSFEYEIDGEELYAQDGSSIGEIFENAEKDAYKVARKDPRLTCEIRRRGLNGEKGEYFDMLEMAKGYGPNTMVVTSDTPWELDDWGEDVGGYNFKRRQTMLRVICRLPNGKIRVTSQSLDKSDRDGLEKIHRFLGNEPRPGELLGQRVKLDVDSDRQDLFVDELTREYDRSLEEKLGGRFYAGRTPADMENTYTFVRAQRDLLDVFMRNCNDDSLFALIAALENRWNTKKEARGLQTEGFVEVRGLSPELEMLLMAQRATQRGKTYSGCGITLTAQGELGSLGYGNNGGDSKEQSYGFNRKMHCVVCQKKPKAEEPPKMCGPCGICKGCDGKLRKASASQAKNSAWN